ncbi:MAG: heme-binding protein [Proteobacteria bacterium]|nr:heme-binding protein [Pseudomonadota bacterium]MDA0914831.1 heme-binding protein [Pseudomonadota bacterium]MDA1032108.1 heme-binding protein [Pseudomonadota bacterium]
MTTDSPLTTQKRLLDPKLKPDSLDRMRWYWILPIAAAGVVFLAAIVWSLVASNVETPDYEILVQEGQIELRQYDPMIVAEANVEGEREQAIGRGFRIIANYIFGNNLTSEKVAMTAPVTQQRREKIAMTAPFTQQPDGNAWKVRFVMPSVYTMETLPSPVSPEVELIAVPSKRLAAIQFSGFAYKEALDRHTQHLQNYIEEEGLRPKSEPIYAFYNDPWTLPFMRRNEVMIEIAE